MTGGRMGGQRSTPASAGGGSFLQDFGVEGEQRGGGAGGDEGDQLGIGGAEVRVVGQAAQGADQPGAARIHDRVQLGLGGQVARRRCFRRWLRRGRLRHGRRLGRLGRRRRGGV